MKTRPLADDRKIGKWRCHTAGLLAEVLSNHETWILHRPMQILSLLLAEVATRASKLGDVPLDDLMVRLALYEQGDPTKKDGYDLDAAVRINEARVRDLHSDSAKADLDAAIAIARLDEFPWEDQTTIQRPDWRRHVGEAIRRAWPNLPFAARVAVALDAGRLADADMGDDR